MTDRSDQPDIHDLRRQIETLWAAYLDPQIGGLELAERHCQVNRRRNELA
jgi:hypothetical protein